MFNKRKTSFIFHNYILYFQYFWNSNKNIQPNVFEKLSGTRSRCAAINMQEHVTKRQFIHANNIDYQLKMMSHWWLIFKLVSSYPTTRKLPIEIASFKKKSVIYFSMHLEVAASVAIKPKNLIFGSLINEMWSSRILFLYIFPSF